MAKPQISFAVLADAHKDAGNGKIDCFGIFDNVGLWAAPATRECSVVFGIRDIPAGPLEVSHWLRVQHAGRKAIKILQGHLNLESATRSVIVATRIPLSIERVVPYELGVAIGEELRGQNALWIPLETKLFPWPAPLGKEELAKVLADPKSIKSARALLICSSCKNQYIFQINLDSASPIPADARSFPETGEFRCPECSTVHHLKDIEGQLRAQLGKQSPSSEGRQ